MSLLNIDNTTDPNKILPITYNWARECYKVGVANNWVPTEVPMQEDIELWKSDKLTEDERKLILWNLGFFATAESLTANNIGLALYQHITNPECRMYLIRQIYEESIHTEMFIYICDSLGLDPEEIYTMYQNVPSIKAKDDFVVGLTTSVFKQGFKVDTPENIQKLMLDISAFYLLFEGISFYGGFAMMLALKRKNKMVGVGQQFEYTLRDESVHVKFGTHLINTLKVEYPDCWTDGFKDNLVSLVKEMVQLEQAYAHDACTQKILGINPDQFCYYVEFIADRRLESIGLDKIYGTDNPFPWLNQAQDLAKEKNFFETTVTEYQTSGNLTWD